jgi:hypothetical protein
MKRPVIFGLPGVFLCPALESPHPRPRLASRSGRGLSSGPPAADPRSPRFARVDSLRYSLRGGKRRAGLWLQHARASRSPPLVKARARSAPEVCWRSGSTPAGSMKAPGSRKRAGCFLVPGARGVEPASAAPRCGAGGLTAFAGGLTAFAGGRPSAAGGLGLRPRNGSLCSQGGGAKHWWEGGDSASVALCARQRRTKI